MVDGYYIGRMAAIIAINGGVTVGLLIWFLGYVLTHKCKH